MSDSSQNTSRREFLRSSAAKAAAVTLGLNALGTGRIRSAYGANEKVRVALQVRADDFVPRRAWVYQISWDGQWPDAEAEFWQHVHVEEVTES